jgi:hypothetical protein
VDLFLVHSASFHRLKQLAALLLKLLCGVQHPRGTVSTLCSWAGSCLLLLVHLCGSCSAARARH